MTYHLELSARLLDVHYVVHVPQLKKCLTVLEGQLPLEELDVQEDLSYLEQPIRVWTGLRGILGTRQLRCAKYSGAVTQKIKLLGKKEG